jgi:transposase-like protein
MAAGYANTVGMILPDFYRDVDPGQPIVTIDWLRQQGLLAARMDCPNCMVAMAERDLSIAVDQRCWRCGNRGCRKRINIRAGSFFGESRLTLAQITSVIYMWSIELTSWQIEQHTRVSQPTVVQWLQYLRDECSWDLVQNPRPIGGVGHIVAVDESLVARRKPGNRQGRPVREQWVFGGVDLQNHEFFMELVPQRDAATLLPIVQRSIAPGTTIWSDMWLVYNALPGLGFPHQAVNHSQFFVDPVTGVHTNHIESRWKAMKDTLRRKSGVRRRDLPDYLDEYMWRRRRDRDHMFSDMLGVIRQHYPV